MIADDDTPTSCSDPTCTAAHPPRGLTRRAGIALAAAIRGDQDECGRNVAELVESYGFPGVWAAINLWSGVQRHWLVAAGVDVSRIESPTFTEIGGRGDIRDVDEVPPPARWAGRWLVAYMREDHDQLAALARTINHDPDALTECMAAVLQHCALSSRLDHPVTRRAT